MNNKKILILATLLPLLGGCPKMIKHLEPTGGSRADGTIEMQYSYGMLENFELEEDEALKIAKNRCKAWGYQNAEPFGGQNAECLRLTKGGNCLSTRATVKYQCLGNIKP